MPLNLEISNKPQKRPIIGITVVNLETIEERKYANGLYQNIIFLYDYLLNNTNACVRLISHNLPKTLSTKLSYNAVNCDNTKEILKFDFIIQMGLVMSNDIMKEFINNGGKYIVYSCGNLYYNIVNDILYKKNNKSVPKENIQDEVWVIPQFEFALDFYKLRYESDNVHVGPYFWEPKYVDDKYSNTSLEKINVGVFEANLCSNKSFAMPLCICDKAADYINKVSLADTKKFEQNWNFRRLIEKSKLYKEKKLKCNARYSFRYIMDNFCNVVVSFVENWDLNYLFLECFYLGIPLIHNSKMLKDYGYYYDGFDVDGAVEHFRTLKEKHNTKEYIERHKPILEKYSMKNPEYIDFFNKKLGVKGVINHKIPKIIFQTGKDDVEDNIKDYIKLYFPEYEYYYFKDKDIIEFIQDNPLDDFPNAINVFNSFETGAHKADFFRYYFLYIKGGIFLDSDAMLNTNIKDIIRDYNEVYIASNFFKDTDHIFNGFICTYSNNIIMYDALKHMYECKKINNYQMFCEELYKILKNKNPNNIKIYKELLKREERKDESIVYNDENEKILTHYFREKKIPEDHK